jgi:hypothetical protein
MNQLSLCLEPLLPICSALAAPSKKQCFDAASKALKDSCTDLTVLNYERTFAAVRKDLTLQAMKALSDGEWKTMVDTVVDDVRRKGLIGLKTDMTQEQVEQHVYPRLAEQVLRRAAGEEAETSDQAGLRKR